MCVTVETNAFHGGEESGRGGGRDGTTGPGPEALGDTEAVTRPAAHDEPDQVAGALDLMLAVARLTVAGLSRRAWSAEGAGERGRRAAYGR